MSAAQSVSRFGCVAVLAVAASIGVAANQATADPTTEPRIGGGDAQYLGLIKTHIAGITNTEGDAGLIKGGHAICAGLQAGRSRQSIFLQFVQGHGWSDSDASWMITASVVAYCP